MKYTIGCTSRPYESLTFSEACEHISAAGYTDVAVFANAGQNPVRANSTSSEIRATSKTAANAGLTPSAVMGSVQFLKEGLEVCLDDYKRLIDNVAALGAKWLLDCGTASEADYNDYYELMRRAAPHAAQAGVNIALKPHGGISLTVQDLIRADQEVSHSAFGICYDPGNIIYYTKGELRPETDIDAVASRVTTVIVKDCVVQHGTPDVRVTPGEGLVDFKRVMDGLVASGFDGPLYVECVAGSTLNEINANIESTLRFVRGILT